MISEEAIVAGMEDVECDRAERIRVIRQSEKDILVGTCVKDLGNIGRKKERIPRSDEDYTV